jgi:hypothetical protein
MACNLLKMEQSNYFKVLEVISAVGKTLIFLEGVKSVHPKNARWPTTISVLITKHDGGDI